MHAWPVGHSAEWRTHGLMHACMHPVDPRTLVPGSRPLVRRARSHGRLHGSLVPACTASVEHAAPEHQQRPLRSTSRPCIGHLLVLALSHKRACGCVFVVHPECDTYSLHAIEHGQLRAVPKDCHTSCACVLSAQHGP